MHERQIRWNERHARGEETHDHRPSPPLPKALEGLSPGLALDLACGAGRHAVHLAERGFRVVAVDWAERGIEAMLAEAQRRGVADRVEPVIANLEEGEFAIEPGRYDVVCDFYFLSRPLFPAIRDGVRPGGLFVAAIHEEDPNAPGPHRYLLWPGELAQLVTGWGFELLHAAGGASPESGHEHATTEIIARRPAHR
jgi:SAM-dependent methyltransferase